MRKIPYSHRGGVNNGKIFLIRTAVKHRRGANNEKIILIRTAAVRIAFSLAEFYRLHLKCSLHVHDELKGSARIRWNSTFYYVLHFFKTQNVL